jgi:Zn-finger nucleic acid-binding protein
MSKEIVLNVVLDRCPTCKGMWLDGGELDLLREGIEAGMASDLGRALFVPPF